MKKTIAISLIVASVFIAALTSKADDYVHGYYRNNGTYVKPHYRSNPDRNFYNNWSTYPNINPYSGTRGTRRTTNYQISNSFSTPKYSYSSGRQYSSSNSFGNFFGGR
ncbi:MAG: hypothetical protein H3C64_13450 [Candidatus Kuenenia stuttgartiensis]|jgi:hypothetical protein|uniref:Uncharacterized protein n=1 Tax=Kuenenia stuttgartiensis TaxID=174633 RepID=A0A2C9CHE1_KUEST|nr:MULTISPECIES: hypothetical protein [Kuenenia]MBW7943354.1 hypothetical protein [Candidatus Kuenenia stuttgartiensis]MBZ0193140.1 hypothetical protein [Candidatus Kuenenia stuttgartiensis]MCL4727826.1 hypothetical protein [Candidatus Kuenenia stuttgartiensis]MCZ7621790.1 hypothetical protein [Candidatus Kuenenia sp.]SOH04167.1 hypothetical protein KSMBR1_1668 [Candidatus Kuenenia stuttgartiensis]